LATRWNDQSSSKQIRHQQVLPLKNATLPPPRTND
jgi:hypothetical protein